MHINLWRSTLWLLSGNEMFRLEPTKLITWLARYRSNIDLLYVIGEQQRDN